MIRQQRTLLMLDGVEPLQEPPGPLAGKLKDPGLAALLKGLAAANPGLCVVTTRESITNLSSFQQTAPQLPLEELSPGLGSAGPVGPGWLEAYCSFSNGTTCNPGGLPKRSSLVKSSVQSARIPVTA